MSKTPGLGAAGATKAFARRSRPTDGDSIESPPGESATPSSFLTTLAAAPATGMIEVPIDERLADKPDNPRQTLKDLDGLAKSIQQRGLLQAIVVIRASAFTAVRPDVSLPAHVEWVLLAGHRRRAAARQIGLQTLPAVVRDDQAGERDSLISALIENIHRTDLAPLEEARALATLRDLGMSQRQAAAEIGISQGQVSKRLALLDLPVEMQDAVDAGEVEVGAAMTVARELPDPAEQRRALQQARDNDQPLTTAMRQLQRQPAAADPPTTADPPAAAAPPAASAGDPPAAAVPAEPAQPSPHEAPALRSKAGQELHDERDEPRPTTEHEDQEDQAGAEPPTLPDAAEQHAEAAKERAEACRAAVSSALKATEVTALLIDVTLDPPNARPSRALTLAAEWAQVDLPADDTEIGLAEILNGGGKTAQRLAVAMALVRRESDLAGNQTRHQWDAAARRHVQRLIDWGVHTASPYEQAKLDEPTL